MSAQPAGTKKLKKELRLLDVYAIAMGTTLSSGFFLLPGLAFSEAGPALVISYVLAALLVVPAMYSMVELATAMPKAGGAYYFLDRSMGPLVGTIGGLGTWLVLILKSAFALIGMGAYISLFLPEVNIQTVAVGLAFLFGLINLFGAKKTGTFQIVLVLGLILILIWFCGVGLGEVRLDAFSGMFDTDSASILATTGLVYISFAGLTKVTSVAEEVKDPERNIARGMLLALISAVVIYVVGTVVMVGVVPADVLDGDLTPVASAADRLVGTWGRYLVTVAAVFGFFAAANAGILSASRYPLAMGRDQLLPGFFRDLNRWGTPSKSVYVTVGLVLACLLVLDPTKIAKLAGAFQLIMFGLLCLAVIVMRESRIDSYDPGYRSPFYPWMQLFGLFAPLVILAQMGGLSILFSIGLVGGCIAWYYYYARHRVIRDGAIYHWFARLGKRQYDELDRELRTILKEKGLRKEDPFDEIVARSFIIDLDEEARFEEIVGQAAAVLAERVPLAADEIAALFVKGTQLGATPVTHGVALPHFRTSGISVPEMVLVRSKPGVHIVTSDPLDGSQETQDVHTVFFLVSPEDDPGQHLRILAQIAQRVDEEHFAAAWDGALDEQELKEVLLRDERFLSLRVEPGTGTAVLIGKPLHDVRMPEGTLIALIRRGDRIIIPRGSTSLEAGDQLTIIGEPKHLRGLYRQYRPADKRV